MSFHFLQDEIIDHIKKEVNLIKNSILMLKSQLMSGQLLHSPLLK